MAANIFRRSLFLKVFTISSSISIALIYFLGSNLYNRIADGIFEEKITASIPKAMLQFKMQIIALLSQALIVRPISHLWLLSWSTPLM